MNTRFAPESEIDKSTVLGAKPFKRIEKIIDNVLPHARGIIARGEIIHYCSSDTRQCFLLLHGSVALHRRGDGMVLNSESAPFILGVSSQLSSEHLYVRALETSEVASISLARFNHVVAQQNLWERFSNLLIYTASRVTNIAPRYRKCRLMTLSAFSWLS
ncbi:hypothetical protein ACVXG7_17895 [Enterobacter hormaechei]